MRGDSMKLYETVTVESVERKLRTVLFNKIPILN